MFDRALIVGTFPDEGACRLVFGLCSAAAALLLALAILSWLKGGRCGS